MTMHDCSSEMQSFHDEKVTLGRAAQKEMHDRRNAGRTRLDTGLAAAEHAPPILKVSQGSYAMRTMVQDSDSDYDIDDGIYFRKEDLHDKDGNELSPWTSRQRVAKALRKDERLKHDAENLANCVRQFYPEGYHIDLPIYRLVAAKGGSASSTICERACGDAWVESDGRAVTKWFKDLVGDLSRDETDGRQLRRIAKLTKKFARRQPSWKFKTTSGITLTKLVTENFVAKPGREDEALHETWKRISARLKISTAVDHPVTFQHPRLANEGDSKVEFFRDCLSDALESLKVLDDHEKSKKQACRAWDNVFNADFFAAKYEDSQSKALAAHTSLVRPAVAAGGAGMTFPPKPIQPNKSQGFA